MQADIFFLALSYFFGCAWAITYNRIILIDHMHPRIDDPNIRINRRRERYHSFLLISHISWVVAISAGVVFGISTQRPLFATAVGVGTILIAWCIRDLVLKTAPDYHGYRGKGRPRTVVIKEACGHVYFVAFCYFVLGICIAAVKMNFSM